MYLECSDRYVLPKMMHINCIIVFLIAVKGHTVCVAKHQLLCRRIYLFVARNSIIYKIILADFAISFSLLEVTTIVFLDSGTISLLNS